MTRDDLMAELLVEQFGPYGQQPEHVPTYTAPIVLAYALDEDDDRPDAQLIRLDDRRAAA